MTTTNNSAEHSNDEDTWSELLAAVELRRQDPEFMGRLHRILHEDRKILDLLAGR